MLPLASGIVTDDSRFVVQPAPGPLVGRVRVPGDKSISHRGLLLGALARGTTRIDGLLESEDTRATRAAVRALGADVRDEGGLTLVTGAPWQDATTTLDCGNSGTTARLLLGALAPRANATLTGDASLSRRPMARVARPLAAMGASVEGGTTLPLTVRRRALHGIDWTAEVPSAQVKSAVLLAGLAAEGGTTYRETVPTRDHTERMLAAMGAAIVSKDGVIVLEPGPLGSIDLTVPGDISSAAFWLVAASLVARSDVTLEGVGLNPARTGVLAVLARMGAALTVAPRSGVEAWGDVNVRGSTLRGTVIQGDEIPTLIDELPVLAVAAAFAEGETVIRDAAELRVKESDRIATTVAGLRALGFDADERPDGMVIAGGGPRRPATSAVPSHGDHRIAMAFAIAGLRVGATLDDVACVGTSYPGFFQTLSEVQGA